MKRGAEDGRAAKLREREARRQFLAEAKAHTPLVAARAADGAIYLVSTARKGHAGPLFAKGASPEMRVMREALAILDDMGLGEATGGTFVDVGANLGTSTITALRVHGFRDAVACEPAPDSVRLLRMNLIANDLDQRAQVIPAAISDRSGTVQFAISRLSDCKNRVVDDEPDAPTIVVDSVSLDQLAERGVFRPEEVGVLWIDAEGHEPHVLRGASTLIERGTTIVIEYNPELLGSDGMRDL
jgi:FkbM family methyltransferase